MEFYVCIRYDSLPMSQLFPNTSGGQSQIKLPSGDATQVDPAAQVAVRHGAKNCRY